ncbi:MAG TPA: L,D-transpeptidase family protein [Acidimicrobiales bacterium]|nr:L,D-transpeptidase family protein [Acidimicrobiales bacterium]
MGRGLSAVVMSCLMVVACGSTKPTNDVTGGAPTSAPAPAPTVTIEAPMVSPATAPTTIAPEPVPAATPTGALESSDLTPPPSDEPSVAGLPGQLADISGGQAIIVTAPGYGSSTATLTAYSRTAEGWEEVFGPWAANVGVNGVARAGEKTEGDGKTPSGTYGFGFAFGVNDDPGTRLPYRQITSPSIVWVEDPASPLYNEWVDTDIQDAPGDSETMLMTPVYNYGAVIAYNVERAPGAGSGIFLHVSHGGPTAGCVSLPEPQLLELLRWIEPNRDPSIAIGVA